MAKATFRILVILSYVRGALLLQESTCIIVQARLEPLSSAEAIATRMIFLIRALVTFRLAAWLGIWGRNITFRRTPPAWLHVVNVTSCPMQHPVKAQNPTARFVRYQHLSIVVLNLRQGKLLLNVEVQSASFDASPQRRR